MRVALNHKERARSLVKEGRNTLSMIKRLKKDGLTKTQANNIIKSERKKQKVYKRKHINTSPPGSNLTDKKFRDTACVKGYCSSAALTFLSVGKP